MRKVELRMNEQRKYELIKELVEHGGNKKRVTLKLHITVRPLVWQFLYKNLCKPR